MQNFGRVLSRPVKIHWAGWDSDTYKLQQRGWSIAVDFEPYNFKYRLALHHNIMDLYAITESFIINNSNILSMEYNDNGLLENVIFNVISIGRVVYTQAPVKIDCTAFKQIDAQPSFTVEPIKNIADFNIFSMPLVRTKEILVDKADMSVVEHLEAISKLQEPKQKGIRAKILKDREAGKPEQFRSNIIAQLVHYDEAA